MEKPEQKFKVGDRVADIHTGKVGEYHRYLLE